MKTRQFHPLMVLMILAFAIWAPFAAAQNPLVVTFSTTQAGGSYAPKNVVVVWITNSSGTFVRTIGRWANRRASELVEWYSVAGSSDVDGLSGATRANHTGTLTASWDLKNRSGQVVPYGTYNINFLLTDSNNSTY